MVLAIKKSGKSYKTVCGDEIKNANDIFSSIENISMFGHEREELVTVVKRLSLSKDKSIYKNLEQKIKDGFKKNLYILEEKKLDKTSALLRFALKYGQVFETRTPSLDGIKKFAQNIIQKEGLSINQNVLNELSGKLPQDKYAISNEIEKLIILAKAHKKNHIDIDDLNILLTNEIEIFTWDLIDAISVKDKNKAFLLVNRLLKRNEDFPLIIAAITNQLELLSLIMSCTPTDILTSKFKVHPYVVEKNQRHINRFTRSQIKMLFLKTANLDFSVKQGKIEPRLGLNMLITTL